MARDRADARRKGRQARDRGPQRSGPSAAAAPHVSTRWTRWVAYGILALYAIYWAVKAFTVHHIGNYAVETDFYWKYGPAARDLLHGRVDIANYDSKGWGYPAVVAALSVLGLDPFRAAQILAVLSAVLAGWLLYRIHRSLLGPAVALASLLLLLSNPTFLANTYEVGTDMFFFAIVLGSLALLLRSGTPGMWAILASGALGGWAFSTRYNGLFLWPGALFLFLVLKTPGGTPNARLRRAAAWSVGFVIAALPWLLINAAHTGNPLTNSNYVNVGYAVYGEGNWEKFFYGGGRQVHSFADIVRLDPGRFLGVMAKNLVEHLRSDLSLFPPKGPTLLPVLWGVLAVVGALVLARERQGGRRLGGYAAFWALYFLTLVPVFYGTRFSLPLLAIYLLAAAWPFASGMVGQPIQGLERSFPLRAFVFLALWLMTAFPAYQFTEDPTNPENVQAGPYDIVAASNYLRDHAAGKTLLARKPHAAFLAGMHFVPIPEFDRPDSLHAIALRAGAGYVLVSGAELGMRAGMRPFAMDAAVPGFTRVFESEGALVYAVNPGGARP